MKEKQIDIAARAADSSPITETMESNSLFTRREMLGITGMGLAGLAGLTAFTGFGPDAVAQTAQKRPRIACLVSYWGLPTSHADWIVNKLIDGYWWNGAHTPSRVDVVAVYVHQYDTSLLAQKVCKAKNIPMFKTVGEAVTLGGKELAVDGVVIVAEHGNYPTDLRGHWLLPRWWIYQQVMRVFEQSKRSVPVFNDKHLSYNWDDAKWMYDKSRELKFPLTGGSSIPTYFRKPEIDIAADTPLKNGLVIGGMADEGASFHCIDVLQSFMDRRKGGETGVKSVQSIRGPEAWKWVEANAWANNLLEAVRKNFDLPAEYFQQGGQQGNRPQGARPPGRRGPPDQPLHRGVQRRDQSGLNFGQRRGLDLRRRRRRAERPDDHIDAWLARSHLAVPCCERPRALDHRDDADRKGAVQCGAAASINRDYEPLYGLKLAERRLLCRGTCHRDSVHEHDISVDTRTDVFNGAAAAKYSLHTGF